MTKREIFMRLGRVDEEIEELEDRIDELEDEENRLLKILRDYDEEAKDRAYDEFEERRRARKYD